MPDINLLAVLGCGVASMVLGALWYSPALFARSWQKHAGVSDQAITSSNLPLVYGLAFVLSLLAAYVLAMFIGPEMSLGAATAAGAAAGVAWVSASFGINYLFERKSLTLWLINGGYHALQFTLFGLIIGAWR